MYKKDHTQSTMILFVCIILSAFLLFSCAGASNALMDPEKTIMITLKVLNISDKDPVSVEIEFTLVNDTDEEVEVLKWGTPLEGEFNENMYDVTQNGQQLSYLGRQFKRGAPQAMDFVTMIPQSELTATVLLEKAYAIKGPGLYTVQYRKPYISVRSDKGTTRLVPVVSNRVEFRIGK